MPNLVLRRALTWHAARHPLQRACPAEAIRDATRLPHPQHTTQQLPPHGCMRASPGCAATRNATKGARRSPHTQQQPAATRTPKLAIAPASHVERDTIRAHCCKHANKPPVDWSSAAYYLSCHRQNAQPVVHQTCRAQRPTTLQSSAWQEVWSTSSALRGVSCTAAWTPPTACRLGSWRHAWPSAVANAQRPNAQR